MHRFLSPRWDEEQSTDEKLRGRFVDLDRVIALERYEDQVDGTPTTVLIVDCAGRQEVVVEGFVDDVAVIVQGGDR